MKSSDIRNGTTKPSRVNRLNPYSTWNDEELKSRIAVAAYFKAEARGFEPGHDLEDWVTAEMEQQA
jgi:hypothetical protein